MFVINDLVNKNGLYHTFYFLQLQADIFLYDCKFDNLQQIP